MLAEPLDAEAEPDPREVVVTVTTIRYTAGRETPARKIDVVREAVARGHFDEALRRALVERLLPWAQPQVLARVPAKRPGVGQPAAYEGWFSDRRQLLVCACPAGEPGSLPIGRPRILEGPVSPEPGGARSVRRCTPERRIAPLAWSPDGQ